MCSETASRGVPSDLQLYLKRDSGTGAFLSILRNFYEHLFYGTPLGDCFCVSENKMLISWMVSPKKQASNFCFGIIYKTGVTFSNANSKQHQWMYLGKSHMLNVDIIRIIDIFHCVESVQIRSFFWSVFDHFSRSVRYTKSNEHRLTGWTSFSKLFTYRVTSSKVRLILAGLVAVRTFKQIFLCFIDLNPSSWPRVLLNKFQFSLINDLIVFISKWRQQNIGITQPNWWIGTTWHKT